MRDWSWSEWAWIVGGATIAALSTTFLHEWGGAIAYGVGIFVGLKVSSVRFIRLIRKVRDGDIITLGEGTSPEQVEKFRRAWDKQRDA